MVVVVVVMMVVSPLRPLPLAVEVTNRTDVGPPGVQTVRFVLSCCELKSSSKQSGSFVDIGFMRVRLENSNGTGICTC